MTPISLDAQRSLGRAAAVTSIATAIARLTGFVRVVVVAAAMGTTFLANTYQSANTAPNLVFELVAAGVLTSVFVPTFVHYLLRGEQEDGWQAANALTSVAVVALVALALLLALAAPLVMQLFTIGVESDTLRAQEIEVGSAFLRLFAPQVVFYGLGMIMTAALHARRRFVLAAVAPIFNNAVVIVVYLVYAAMRGERAPDVTSITAGEVFVLGAGTTAGVIAMTLCLVPPLVRAGWRFRWRFERSHPAVRKGARLGAWALGYAGGYQAGLIVVLILANRLEGGVAAYQWAYTFFYVPHALFAVPLFNVLFTAMSEHAVREEARGVASRLGDGLALLAFVLAPVGAALLAVAEPVAQLTLEYGVMSGVGASLVARTLQAFALGLPAYSAFLVLTRAYYATSDTKTPALVNAGTVALSSVLGALFFFTFDDAWAIPGLALGHSLAFVVGSLILARSFFSRWPSASQRDIARPVLRACLVAFVALIVMATATFFVDADTKSEALVELALAGLVGVFVYVGVMKFLAAPELTRVANLVGSRRA